MAGVTAVASSLASYHKGWVDLCLFTNLSVPYDLCVGVPISCLLTVGVTWYLYSVFSVIALVGAINQEKALVGAFYIIVKTFV